ncbi:hypothetical protein D3C71_1451850 [compost metagenome]
MLAQLRGQRFGRVVVRKQILDGAEAIARSRGKALEEIHLAVEHGEIGGKAGHGGLFLAQQVADAPIMTSAGTPPCVPRRTRCPLCRYNAATSSRALRRAPSPANCRFAGLLLLSEALASATGLNPAFHPPLCPLAQPCPETAAPQPAQLRPGILFDKESTCLPSPIRLKQHQRPPKSMATAGRPWPARPWATPWTASIC